MKRRMLIAVAAAGCLLFLAEGIVLARPKALRGQAKLLKERPKQLFRLTTPLRKAKKLLNKRENMAAKGLRKIRQPLKKGFLRNLHYSPIHTIADGIRKIRVGILSARLLGLKKLNPVSPVRKKSIENRIKRIEKRIERLNNIVHH